jgi:hypothetical protein
LQEFSTGILQAIPHPTPSMQTDIVEPHTGHMVTQQLPSPITFHPFYSHLFSNLSLADHERKNITDAIQRGSLIACCDGSFDPITRHAAYGLVLADTEAQEHLLKPQGPCVGYANARSAIRADLRGLTASTYLLFTLVLQFGVQRGSLIVYNDCSKALKYINHPGKKFRRFLIDDYDLIS